jgi:hypothetical protein
MLPEDIAEAQPDPRVTIDGLGSAVVDVAPGDSEDGEIRVTILDIREDAGYGESVPYPGTTFLAVRSRQEAIQSTDGGAGALRWIALPSDGSAVLPVLAWRIEGGYEPTMETRLALRPDESLEGWMHLVAPATGGVDAYWTLGGSTVEPSLRVRLRPDLVIGSGVTDGVPWEAVAYEEFGGRVCTIVVDRSSEDSAGGGACASDQVTEPGIVFASMSGQPLIAHGVTTEGVATGDWRRRPATSM